MEFYLWADMNTATALGAWGRSLCNCRCTGGAATLPDDGGVNPLTFAAAAAVSVFTRWLARPLFLRCLFRTAAAQELLRQDAAGIVHAHRRLINEGYCVDLVADLGYDGLEAATHYTACTALLCHTLT